MSVISYFHRKEVKRKGIFKALLVSLIGLFLLFTIVGKLRCKIVDKVSDNLIFRYNEDASVSSLDPAYVKSQSELWIAGQIYNGLIDLDSNLQPVPMLAKSWEISPDGLVYKFVLRTDIQYYNPDSIHNSSGLKFVASDVVFSFTRLLDPQTASPGAWIFSDKIDVEELFDSSIPASQKAFYAPDDSTFILRLKSPNSTMLSQLGTAYCYIVPQNLGNKNGIEFGRNPIGTGPFFLKLWEDDVKLILRKNPNYFEIENGKQLPLLEAINIDFIKNKQTAFMKFVAGDFDFFNGIDGSFKDELLDKMGRLKVKYHRKFKIITMPFLNTEYLGIWLGNSKSNSQALKNQHLRRALNYAVDRASIVKYLRNGIGVPGNFGFIPPVLKEKNSSGYQYLPSRAAEELAAAGYPDGKGCPEIQLTTTADYLDICVYVRKYWEAIGLKVKIDVQTGGMLRQMRNKGDLPLFRGSWFADYADPENFLACFYSKNFSPGGPNYTHFSSAEFDRLYESILLENNAQKRQNLVARADSIVMNAAPVLVLYYDKSVRLYQNDVKGLKNDASNRLILKRVFKEVKP